MKSHGYKYLYNFMYEILTRNKPMELDTIVINILMFATMKSHTILT